MKFAVTVACSLIGLTAAACGDGGRGAATMTPIPPTPAPTSTGVPAMPTAPPSAGTGIEGYVTLGPQCPVVHQDTPCPDAPFEAALSLVDPATGATVATGRSDASGHFRIDAPPGTYRLVPQSFGAMPYASEQDVIVPPSGYAQVAVPYDSGIR